ncbi:LLM class flavin-dependent oxidoreductase [Nocardia puris]|uniref:5,10-methylenetetrahydromethanopterin reductase n=1 Tax=Nocardia puris TaxID=208602 RepID=A0A366E1A0_9NOCA|nr:LLM class flavin-dependent oxidoreductase [Nocardia puris]MBF6209584.1 LLM class flavin-dependent oxidoreductase [Nocardia puris]MBF6366156.1 LLM class flavin-dependent oxidoreductase [Nocardia puris]MBF6458505.1 LLM class flavin-dependent oxidoreductase [Nocardia puris]RBO96150.1 5,10-methylenetetrahydromethanopterin reductase [Nocardia puris]
MTLTLSCSLTSSLASHEHARVAERLGYARAWFYDSPALYADVWVQLCRAAERTERIGLGPGVLVPSLRHPMVTAAAIAELVSLAGADRVAVGVGTGFTGRVSMGQRPSRWRDVAGYIEAVKALLAGEQVEWEGAPMRMLHEAPFAPARPVTVPWVVAAEGPKGIEVARKHADGVLAVTKPIPGFAWSSQVVFGTVLDDGEDPGSERAIAAAGHGASVLLHVASEFGMFDLIPGAREWAETAYRDVPERERHLALHEGHLHSVNDRDRPFVTAELMAATGVALDPARWRDRLAELAEAGTTEIVYQPAGPDIPRELEAFAAAFPH